MEVFKNYFVFKEQKDKAHILVGGVNSIVPREHPNYEDIKKAAIAFNQTKNLEERSKIIDSVKKIINTPILKILEADKDFKQDLNNLLYYKDIDKPIPPRLAKRMLGMLEAGLNLDPLKKFWVNLYLNPNPVIVERIFEFLEKNGHPITDNGYFLAYKSVRKDNKVEGLYQPHHVGKYGNDITVGSVVKMPHDECDHNQDATCSYGLHVGNMKYVKDFGDSDSTILEVLINPKNVVAIPPDYDYTKMRVSEYFVLGVTTGENTEIYLESDYKNYVVESISKEIEEIKAQQEAYVQKINEEIKQRKLLVGLLAE